MLQSLRPNQIKLLNELLLMEFTAHWQERRCIEAAKSPAALKEWLADYNDVMVLAAHCHAAFGSKKACLLEAQAMEDTKDQRTQQAEKEEEEDYA